MFSTRPTTIAQEPVYGTDTADLLGRSSAARTVHAQVATAQVKSLVGSCDIKFIKSLVGFSNIKFI